jgi:hypothetical protein
MHQNASALIARLQVQASDGEQDPMHQNAPALIARLHAQASDDEKDPMHQNAPALIARLQVQASDGEQNPMHQNGSAPPTPAHADMRRAGQDLMHREERLATMRRRPLPRFHKADRRGSRGSKRTQPQMHADARRWGWSPSRSFTAEIERPDEPRSLGVQGSICVHLRASVVEFSCFLASRTPQRIKPRLPNGKTPCTRARPSRPTRKRGAKAQVQQEHPQTKRHPPATATA